MAASQYNVFLEPDPDGGYVAVIPALPGCHGQGETVEEALANARDAILLTTEDMRERGEPIPDRRRQWSATVRYLRTLLDTVNDHRST